MYLFTNMAGTFVFSDHYKIREKILFSEKDALQFALCLEKKGPVPSEQEYLSKFKSIENIRETQDEKKIEKILAEVIPFREKLCENTMFVTKNLIRNTVNEDLLIIQSSSSVEELNKIINYMVKRLREWYSFYLPEISENVADNKAFVEIITASKKDALVRENKITVTMGADLRGEDITAIMSLAAQVKATYALKEEEERYLERLMKKRCPNITAVTGVLVGAKLLAIAGSLKRLVLFPSSTIQLLGAEKALFRHLKNRKALPPKYGVIFQHPLIQKAKKSERGKVARILADKISLAAKIDYFKGEYRGDTLIREIQEKLAGFAK